MKFICAITLPVPPSTNALTFNRKKGATGRNGKRLRGRGKTPEYTAWIEQAGKYLLTQKPLPRIEGEFAISISLPCDCAIDIDNLKAIPDALKRFEIIGDDGPKYMRDFHASNLKAAPGTECVVVVSKWEDKP